MKRKEKKCNKGALLEGWVPTKGRNNEQGKEASIMD
jgi:hypothetical protein